MAMRLDKFLHDTGYGSRKEIRKAVARGQVELEGELVKDPAMQVDESALVLFDGEEVRYRKQHTLLLYKPAGVLSATKDSFHETVMDLLPEQFMRLKLAPVGRLDIDTTGLLLITNDGQLSHRLTSPKYEVPKVYEFSYEGKLAADASERVAEGIDLGDFYTKPGQLTFLGDGRARLRIHEGKFHQVKRMVQALGGEVTALERTVFGPLVLPEDMDPGEWRYLTEEELESLQAASQKET